jgi:hypothetical protein
MASGDNRSRTDPFAGQSPNVARDYGRAPSDQSASGPADRLRALDGRQARYRLAFVAMEVPGLPAVVQIGPVEITQQAGPIWTQHTYIRQRPGWRPRYDKTMHHGYLQVGEGLQLTLAELPVVVPHSEHIHRALAYWRDQTLAAVSILAAVLDERVAQRELLEDLIVYDSTGSRPWAAVDNLVRVRDFLPKKRVLPEQRQLLDGLAAFDLSHDSPELGAARWYLRAVQSGPTPDAVVFLWIAMEALAPPTGKSDTRGDVRRVEDALKETGLALDQLDLSIGRLAGLRGDVVHKGIEQPELLYEGFYELEALTRLLLRHRLGVVEGAWPLTPSQSMLLPGLQGAERWLRDRPRTMIRRVDNGPPLPDQSEPEG